MKWLRYLLASLVLVASMQAPHPAQAAYPTHEIRLIVPWNAGGSNDLMARILQQVLEKKGVKLIVENVPGGSSVVGMGQVATAAPDGYTLGLASTSLLVVIAEGKLPITLDQYSYITRVSEDPVLLMVSKNSPFKTLKAFMDNIKANPGKVTIGAPGARTNNDLVAILASRSVGSTHRSVPYPGGSRVVAELLGGHIDAASLKPGESMEVLKSGDAIPLGFFTRERMAIMPDVPTFQELGYDVFQYGQLTQMSFVVGPAKLPPDVQKFLTEAFAEAVRSDEFQSFGATNGFVAKPITGDALKTAAADVTKAFSTVLQVLFPPK